MENTAYHAYINYLFTSLSYDEKSALKLTICDSNWNILWENVPLFDAYDIIDSYPELKFYRSNLNSQFIPQNS